MGKIMGYARISRNTQKIERQIENIKKAYPEADIWQEIYTGRKIEGRKVFNGLLKKVKEGDTLVFDSVSRMSRNKEEGTKLYFDLFNRGVNLVFLKEGYINTDVYRMNLEKQIQINVETGDTSLDNLVNSIIDALNQYTKDLAVTQIAIAFEQAEKEVEDLRVRTREGMREAKKRGKQIGQKKGATFNVAKKEPAKKKIKECSKDFDGFLCDKDVMKLAGVSRNTYYKYKRELTEELQEAAS
jgi:DNA invertase Pin-like site-specific DNA recombinase